MTWESLAWALAGAGVGVGVSELLRTGRWRTALALMQLQVALQKMSTRYKKPPA